jgi:hypothetical protein
MATGRNRKRIRTDLRSKSPIFTEKGAFAAPGPIDTESETMLDYVSGTWPKREIVRVNLAFPAKLGFPKKSDASWSMRVGPLNYTSVSVREPVSSVIMKVDVGPPVYISVKGPFIGSMRTIGSTMDFPIPSLPSYPSFADMAKKLKSDVVLKALDPEYSFGEPLGELKGTLKLIKDPLHSLFRMSKSFSLKKEALKAASRTPKQYARGFAGVYAKYQFGAAPAVRSIQDAIDANVNFMTHNYLAPQLKATRAKMSSSAIAYALASGATLNVPSSVSALGAFFYVGRTIIQQEREVRVGLYQTRVSPSSKREYLGLTANDIVETSWELFPYSFLIDRIINIKKFLKVSRYIFNSKVEFRGGWEVNRLRTTQSSTATLTGASGKSPRNRSMPPRIDESFSMTRIPWSPNLSDVLPPQSGSGLLSSLTKTFDVASIVLLRFTK